MKAFKLQMVVQAPMSATASSKYYLGPLDQRPSIWGLGKMLPQQFRDHAPNENDVPFPWHHNSPKRKGGNERVDF